MISFYAGACSMIFFQRLSDGCKVINVLVIPNRSAFIRNYHSSPVISYFCLHQAVSLFACEDSFLPDYPFPRKCCFTTISFKQALRNMSLTNLETTPEENSLSVGSKLYDCLRALSKFELHYYFDGSYGAPEIVRTVL